MFNCGLQFTVPILKFNHVILSLYQLLRDQSVEDDPQLRKVSATSFDTVEENKDQSLSRRSSLQSMDTDGRCACFSIVITFASFG